MKLIVKFAAPRRAWLVVCILLLAFAGCSSSKSVSTPKQAEAVSPPAPKLNVAAIPPDSGPPPSINASRAWNYTKQVVAFGARPIGSENHRRLEAYIHAHLRGDEVQDDDFTANTPAGPFPIHNIIAKFPGSKDGIIVVAGHYDTNYPFRNNGYVGANDGGSSTALLLELAGQLHSKKLDGYSVWLVWTDGEEAVKKWTDTDSVYGSRHLAELWQQNGTLKKTKAFLLVDMIGDADLNIDQDENSTPWLEQLVYEAATRLGYQSHFFAREIAIGDDHTPFVARGVPCADLIDFDYGYDNVFWHTPQDTLDKLSPNSLQITGSVVLETIRLLNKLPQLPDS
jgi:Peptidase family M28